VATKIKILIPDWTYFHCPGATLRIDHKMAEQTILVHLLFELLQHKNKSKDVEAFIELSRKGPKGELCERVEAKLTCLEPRGGCAAATHWMAAFERSQIEEGGNDRKEHLLGERMQLVWHVKTDGGQAAPRRHVHALKLPNDLNPHHTDLFGLVLPEKKLPAIVKSKKEKEPEADEKEDQKEASKEEEEEEKELVEQKKKGKDEREKQKHDLDKARQKQQDSKKENASWLGSLASTLFESFSPSSISSSAESSQKVKVKEKKELRLTMFVPENRNQSLAGFLTAIWNLQERGSLLTDTHLSSILKALVSFATEQLGFDQATISNSMNEFIVRQLMQAKTPETKCRSQGRGQGRAGQGRAGQGRAGQGRAGHKWKEGK